MRFNNLLSTLVLGLQAGLVASEAAINQTENDSSADLFKRLLPSTITIELGPNGHGDGRTGGIGGSLGTFGLGTCVGMATVGDPADGVGIDKVVAHLVCADADEGLPKWKAAIEKAKMRNPFTILYVMDPHLWLSYAPVQDAADRQDLFKRQNDCHAAAEKAARAIGGAKVLTRNQIRPPQPISELEVLSNREILAGGVSVHAGI
ncbi:hypothetical protein VHEMI04512 [[Torrubiella] hemipterigena]|uniref:Uncharacterized protein n=1 Tax=[Torrubiella] hemipterigena TaxID=1531966 RepID=A0A0A1T1I8_9HYPO|nr:hypothetical protein VHEMI04512 [[Torrubiella] hemipterigena]